MWWTKNTDLDDRDDVAGLDLIESFDLWLSERLAEAHAAGKDLAFFDTALEVTGEGRYVGWAHVLLQPGSSLPLGDTWTIYRLHATAR